MAVRKILQYPHPSLRQVCPPVATWDETLSTLIEDMIETMYAGPGAVGLAACQVDALLRVVVMDVTAKTTRRELRVLVNPQIVEKSRNKLMREGCLSFPDYLANIKRATRLTVTYQDRNGETQTEPMEGLSALVVQHEVDHLDGILMIDRITSLKRDWLKRGNF